MKGIVRKRLLALLSAAGLAGTASSAAGQVVKGDQAEKTKTESTVKTSKAKQENAAAQSEVVDKSRKAGGEQQAAQDVVNEKIGPDHIVHKHLAGVKYEDARKVNKASKTHLDAASKDAAKMTKVTNESTAESNAADIKRRKAGAEQDALTVKQKTGAKTATQRKAGGDPQSEAGKKQVNQASPK